jgi:hypothetical protein
MSTASLLRWIALVAGAELAVRGYFADRLGLCHAGAALLALALAALLWQTRIRRAGIALGIALLVLAAVDLVLALRAESEPVSELGPFDCEQRVAVVEAGAELESDLSGQLVLVRDAELVTSASPLGRALENALRAPETDVSPYRETVLAARRAGGDVALVVPADAAIGRSVRALAGSYGIRAIEVGADLDALLAERGCQ